MTHKLQPPSKNAKEVPKNMSSVIDMYIEQGAAAERARYADERQRYADEKLRDSKRIAELEAQVIALGGRPLGSSIACT